MNQLKWKYRAIGYYKNTKTTDIGMAFFETEEAAKNYVKRMRHECTTHENIRYVAFDLKNKGNY